MGGKSLKRKASVEDVEDEHFQEILAKRRNVLGTSASASKTTQTSSNVADPFDPSDPSKTTHYATEQRRSSSYSFTPAANRDEAAAQGFMLAHSAPKTDLLEDENQILKDNDQALEDKYRALENEQQVLNDKHRALEEEFQDMKAKQENMARILGRVVDRVTVMDGLSADMDAMAMGFDKLCRETDNNSSSPNGGFSNGKLLGKK